MGYARGAGRRSIALSVLSRVSAWGAPCPTPSSTASRTATRPRTPRLNTCPVARVHRLLRARCVESIGAHRSPLARWGPLRSTSGPTRHGPSSSQSLLVLQVDDAGRAPPCDLTPLPPKPDHRSPLLTLSRPGASPPPAWGRPAPPSATGLAPLRPVQTDFVISNAAVRRSCGCSSGYCVRRS